MSDLFTWGLCILLLIEAVVQQVIEVGDGALLATTSDIRGRRKEGKMEGSNDSFASLALSSAVDGNSWRRSIFGTTALSLLLIDHQNAGGTGSVDGHHLIRMNGVTSRWPSQSNMGRSRPEIEREVTS